MAELGSSVCLLLTIAALFALAQASPRAKRQISPAVQLDDTLDPIIRLYGYNPTPKRSDNNMKRHIAPSMEAEHDLGSLRALMNVGKRQISFPAEVSSQADLYSRLFDAGRKRGAISPAADLEHQIAMSSFLERAGRR